MTTFLKAFREKIFRSQAPFILCLLILSTLLSVTADAQNSGQRAAQEREEQQRPESKEQIEAKADRIIKAAMKEKQIPGLVLGIVKDGKVVVKKGYGIKSLLSGATPDENTVFYIGSLSKAMTAFGAMLLVDEGKLRLDDPASKYLKGFPPSWQRITVKQFMTHTSGIPQLDRKLPTFEAMLRSADDMPLNFEPGTNQEYNNFNFAVTGQVVEAASGMKYLDFMTQRVFRPLKMDHTGFDVRSENSAEGYELRQGRLESVGEHIIRAGPFAIASGHLQSTMADLLKFEAAIRQRKLLSSAAYREMMTPVVLPPDKTKVFRGTPGWFAREVGSVRVVNKNGAGQGFQCDFHFVPSRGDAIIMLWNLTGKGSGLLRATNDLMQTIFGISQPGKMLPDSVMGEAHVSERELLNAL